MMQEEEQTPPCSMQNGFVNEGFYSEETLGTSVSSELSSSGKPQASRSVAELIPAHQERHDHPEESCGWLFVRPKVLQKFTTAKWVLFWLCWAATIQGMVINGFVNVCITTIEKRYRLKSASTGLIAGMYDIGCVLCAIPVSYLGSLPGASKPRWLGWGMLIMGVGSFVFAMPHFLSPFHYYGGSSVDTTSSVLLCLTKANTSTSCESTAQEWLSNFKYVFLLGQFLHGVGASPLYTLGTTYLDESVPLKMSSLYLGIFHAMAVIGPAIGFVLGGQFLSTYVDAPAVDPDQIGITKDSDQWLGAWWIGFLISGSAAIMISWLGISFPAEIPGGKMRRQDRVNASAHHSTSTNSSFGSLRDLPKAAKVLARNLSFVFLSLAEATEGILLSGFATFTPKVIESQFSVSAGYAALLVGFIAVPAGGGGTFLGGWLVKKFRLQCGGLLKLCFCLSLLCVICCTGFAMSCPNSPFAGVNVPYTNSSGVLTAPALTSSSCNVDCQCQDAEFDPVCGANKLMYFSPCHAGCKTVKSIGIHKVFSQCACIRDLPVNNPYEPLDTGSDPPVIDESAAVRQKCPSTCHLLTIFLVTFFAVMSLTFLISMPAVSGTLRCVPDSYRSLALGLQWVIVRLLGTIPGPILFGFIIDSTCVLWQETCDVKGSCRNYDNYKLSKSMMGVSIIFKALSTFFFLLSWIFYKKRRVKKVDDGNDPTTKRVTNTESNQSSNPIDQLNVVQRITNSDTHT